MQDCRLCMIRQRPTLHRPGDMTESVQLLEDDFPFGRRKHPVLAASGPAQGWSCSWSASRMQAQTHIVIILHRHVDNGRLPLLENRRNEVGNSGHARVTIWMAGNRT